MRIDHREPIKNVLHQNRTHLPLGEGINYAEESSGLSLSTNCFYKQAGEFEQSAHGVCEVLSQNLSSRGETADRFEASGETTVQEGQAHRVARSSDVTVRPCCSGSNRTPSLTSSLVVTRCRPLIPSMAAALGGASTPDALPSFCSHEYRRACNSLERKSVRCKTKFRDRSSIAQSGSLQNCQMGVRIPPVAPSTRAAAGLLSVRLLGFLTRASGIAGQSSPLSRSAA